MQRQQEKELDHWYNSKPLTNRKPLVIRGARQVGKSTLVRLFCQRNNIQLYEINLEKHSQLNEVFQSKKIKDVIEAFEDILEKKINSKERILIFLDEIQATPQALACLRYFYEEAPELPVICAGSLLEFVLNDRTYSMPVGRIKFLFMGPMTFEEFLQAKEENYFLNKIKNISELTSITDEFHKKGIELLREFMFVGGMPEAIKVLLKSGIESVSEVHANIIQTYQADFIKYSKKTHLNKIQNIFRSIFLNPCKKVKYSNLSIDDLSRDTKFNLDLLIQARVTTKVLHSLCQGLPIEAQENEKVFKLLALDVGLMNHVQGVSWKHFKIFDEIKLLTEGVIAEQFVGQHLCYSKASYLEPKLHYWLREGKNENAEVDFILEHEGMVVAFEVKAGSSGKIRSLHQWMKIVDFKSKKAVRFNLSKGQVNEQVKYKYPEKTVEYKLTSLPLYLIQSWTQFI